MNYIARRTFLLIGGLLRWFLTSWYFKKSLKLYFENEDGTEDERQTRINFITAICFIIVSAVIVEFLLDPKPQEFKEY